MPNNPVSRWMTRSVDVLVLAVGWWLLVLSVLSCIEMVTRKLFAFSLQGVDEVGGYTLAIAGAVGFSHTLITRGHTRIDFLVGKLPLKARAALNCLAMVTLAAMALFCIERGWVLLAESIEFQSHATTPLQTPMWIPQLLWFIGWSMFALVCTWLAGHSTWLLARGEHEALNAAYGPQTLQEEIESEAGEVLDAVRLAAAGPAADPALAVARKTP